MDINTTRPNGGLSTQTTGPSALPTVAQAQPNVGSMATIADYLMRKRQVAAQPQVGQSYGGGAPQPAFMPSLGAQQSSPNYEAQQKALNPTTRMRRVQRRSSIPSFGLEGNGLTYDNVQETQLPDGTWSGDAMYGTLAGNEAAAMKGPMDVTKLVGMNFSGLGGGTWGLPQPKPGEKG